MKNRKRAPFGPHKISGVFLGILLISSHSAMAGTDTMTASDPGGTTSFNTAGKWSLLLAPSAGNDYFTSTFEMRGIAPGTFAGDSLTLDAGGFLHGKMNGTLTFSNGTGLFLNGGTIYQANSFGTGSIFGIAGTITANAGTNSFLGASSNESLEISGTIGGSGNLTIAGTANGGGDTSFVTFSAANTISGTVTVTTPSGGVGNATNRLLQLNNVNALQNATLALTGGGQPNLVSFTSASNTGAYNIGALSGAANQALTDTASTAVAISVGANNVSTTYSGILSGAGSLTKVGNGTLTLSGSNTYTLATTISGGTLQLGDGTTDGTIATTSGVTNNAALVYNWIADHAAPYIISGTGALTKQGAGKLTLSAEPTYTGNTTISGGTISVTANSATTFADASTISIATGAVLDLPNATTDVVASLVLNGVAQPAGTYDSATPGGYITGAGKIQVGAAVSGYAAWAAANAPGQTMDLDHDNDGAKNGIEYFMGQTGSTFTANPAAVGDSVTWPMSATYTGVYGTDYEVQYSTDLIVWTQAPIGSGDNTVTVNPGPTPARSVVYNMPTGGKSFVRLVVKN